MSTILETLVNEARWIGWAAGSGTAEQVQREARELGWLEVLVRRDGPPATMLRPVDRADARVNSLNGEHGRSEQPLHTDGAHLADPPDVIVLACEGTSNTRTRLWSGKKKVGNVSSFSLPDHLSNGIFLVLNGKDSFFSVAYSPSGFRYDPGFMVPCDARAKEAVRYFDDVIEMSVEHMWDEPGKLLVIDNRQALHANASVVDEPHHVVWRASFQFKRGVS